MVKGEFTLKTERWRSYAGNPPAFPSPGLDLVSNHQIGSPRWLDAVWSSPPVRDLSRLRTFTQRQSTRVDRVDNWTEGTEGVAVYALEYLQQIGVVRRFKPQACHIPVPDGSMFIPDFLVERGWDGAVGVLELKAARYLTPEVQEKFRFRAALCQEHGLFHMVWTDKFPLTPGMKSTLFRIRQARSVEPPPDEYDAFCSFLRERRIITALDVARAGHSPSLIPIAVRRGDAHVDFTKAIDEHTLVRTAPVIDGRQFFMGSGFDPEGWWNSLPSA
jgi:hypothetical protein